MIEDLADMTWPPVRGDFNVAERVFLRNRMTGIVQEVDPDQTVNTGEGENAAPERLWRYLLRQEIRRPVYDAHGQVVEEIVESKFERLGDEDARQAMVGQGLSPTREA